MATQDPTNELSRLIQKLHRQRKHHAEELERIDATFKQFGIDPEESSSGRSGKKRGRKKGSTTKASRKKGTTKKKGRRRRRKFSKTGEDSVLDFIRGADNPTTAEVNEHWTAEGRGGKADNTLTKLVNANRVKRTNLPGERGSRYTIA